MEHQNVGSNSTLEDKEQSKEISEEASAATPSAAAEAPDPCAELRRQLEEAQAKANDYLDQWRRTAAEFSNYKKRNEREWIEAQKFATAGFIKRLLPVLDDLDRAFANLPDHLKDDNWAGGIRLVHQKLSNLLEQEGVTIIEKETGCFDPSCHEAIAYEERCECQDGDIIDVVQKGYRMGERVLRPAQVRVAKRIPASTS